MHAHGLLSVIMDAVLSALYLAGAKAGCADIHLLRAAVVSLDAHVLEIGFPHLAGLSVRVTHIVSEVDTFAANCTFGHG